MDQVEVREGLIEEQQPGWVNKETGKRYALSFAAGKLVGSALQQVADMTKR